ncbi:MAG: HNH endonuclease signature motif containing protein [bacterium]|nr:HNH endonuclease signature motif containing protein [bacterium]
MARDELRQAVEKIKPGYRDPFRRVRELQGEEGLSGLVKDGNKYQLKYTDIDAKREPRRAVSQQTVQKLVHNQGERCTVCSKEISAEDTRIDVDHRVPRLRGGTTHETNLQVLCRECNIAKSTQCNGCDLICRTCGWAHPEKHRLLKLEPELVLQVNREASRSKKETPDQLANRLLSESLDQLRRSLQDQE